MIALLDGVTLIIKFCMAAFGVALLLGCASTEAVQSVQLTPEQAKAEKIARHYLATNMSSLNVDDAIPEFKEYIDAYEISFMPKEARLPEKPNELRLAALQPIRRAAGRSL